MLGIDKSRIRIARVIPGSAVVDVVIGEDPAVSAAALAEKPFNMTYNMDVSTSLTVLQQVRLVAWMLACLCVHARVTVLYL